MPADLEHLLRSLSSWRDLFWFLLPVALWIWSRAVKRVQATLSPAPPARARSRRPQTPATATAAEPPPLVVEPEVVTPGPVAIDAAPRRRRPHRPTPAPVSARLAEDEADGAAPAGWALGGAFADPRSLARTVVAAEILAPPLGLR